MSNSMLLSVLRTIKYNRSMGRTFDQIDEAFGFPYRGPAPVNSYRIWHSPRAQKMRSKRGF